MLRHRSSLVFGLVLVPAVAEAAAALVGPLVVGPALTHFLQAAQPVHRAVFLSLRYSLTPLVSQVSPPLAAQVLFVSPLQAMATFRADGTTGSVSAIPYAAMVANGVAWSAYGLLGSDMSILLANLPPIVLGSYFCATFYRYRSPGAVLQPFVGAAALFTCGVGAAAVALPIATARLLVGYAGVSTCMLMFAGPLASIRAVLAERSAASLPAAYTYVRMHACMYV